MCAAATRTTRTRARDVSSASHERGGDRVKNRQMEALLTSPAGLGTQLRVARGRHSMQQLADKLAAITTDPAVSKWNSSKVSKLETGKQIATEAEVDLWVEAVNADDATRKLLQQLRLDAETKRTMLRRRTPSGQTAAGSAARDLEAVAAVTQVVQPSVVPDLLQVDGYARAILVIDGLDEAVEGLHERQKVLHDSGKTFMFILSESVLHATRGGPNVMAAQLDRLVSVTSLDNVKLGILPYSNPGPVINAGFALYDGEEAVVADGVENRHYTGESAAKLKRLLDDAWESAVKDRAARRLILDAADALGVD
jgi:hypothetical protein